MAFLWLWIGVVYHLIYFSSINPAAYIFAGLFILQGILFFISDTMPHKTWYRFHINNYSIIGSIFILYGLIIYPVWGFYLGHVYPQSPTFGLPCPTTIFTFGLLLWTDTKIPKYLLVIPALWSLIGFLAAIQLGVSEDIMLLTTGLVATGLIWYRDKKLGRKEIIAGRILRLPVIAWIYETLQRDDDRRVAWAYFEEELQADFGDFTEQQLDLAISWGRHAELFAYDDDTGELFLES